MDSQKKRSSSRGAISAGVFIALYLAVYVIIGVACMPVPILFLLMPELVALVAAPVYHTMLSKSPSGTPIFIAAILPSLILIASGHIPIAPLVSVPVGIAAVLIARKGQYKSFKWNAASHAVFSWNLLGGFVPIWFMRDYFFQDTFERGMSADFCDTLYALTPDWVFLAMMLAIVVFSLAGSLIARKLLAGRLESAGIL
ncbi:MptD family putative ECF transporter S component [Slackia exigua]|uniref:MptD family putative ECF transporter S component n=1 Tax=Slackia TaxID=84108 RepID=UPI00027C45EF|nr:MULTISPECIES: MptD family putative ECF transporter S component [Slackia]MDU6011538.1 MptD family putative ECF transporter S component [Slackia sp.]EJU34413.1 TIGR02185 family protein [Slackia sp. CM382]MCQ5091013.1 MptD family putative ECF transporter S component [Slackia exigua]MDK7723462.1 MptD family putative ECF transporter S component [Slackia exigua]MDK7724817.1 MptD family putative ECF transporter S component [Slackia exigua]